MKSSNLIYLLFFLIILQFSLNKVQAQLCVPNPMYTGSGVYPDTVTNMVPGCLGSFYLQDFTINVPDDTTISGFTIPVDFVQIDNVVGLPAGMIYSCNPPTCQYPGGSSGCFRIYGTPGASGVFNLTFNVHGQVTIFGTPYPFSYSYVGYKLKIGVHPTLSTGNIPATCNLANASAWVTASGSSGYTYSWNTVPASTNDTIFNQTAGIYQITVNDLYNCATIDTVFLNDLGAPQIDSITTNDVLCYNDSTGSATAFVSGGTPPYYFVWGNGDSVITMTGVGNGTYTLQVADLHGCLANDVAVINEPPQLLAFASHTNALCFGSNDGTASVLVIGGTGGYAYVWTSGDTTLVADSLTAGTYTITTTDDNGCTATASTTVVQPTPVTVNISGTDESCFGGSTGSATASGGGGTPGYTYLWSTSDVTSVITSLPTGIYSVTVTDSNGCSVIDSITIDSPPAISISLVGTNESMLTMMDGSIDATVGGGTPGYTYLWSNSATTQDISGLAGGTYTLTVTDTNGCTMTDTLTIQTLPGFGLVEQNDIFNLYPNPATGYIFIEMTGAGVLTLFDLLGNQLLSKNLNEGKQMVDLPALSKGSYMLAIQIGNQQRVTKLMIE
jgi:hypothetical protein